MTRAAFPRGSGSPGTRPRGSREDEVVIAQVLKARGYATGMLGKWHLGWNPEDMPIHYGFDYYYGIPSGEDESDFVLGDAPTTDGVSPDQLARRYTQEAVKFITANREQRFSSTSPTATRACRLRRARSSRARRPRAPTAT